MDSRFMEGPRAGWAGWWLLRARHKGGQADVRKREHNELSGWSDFTSNVYPDSVNITFAFTHVLKASGSHRNTTKHL